MRLSFFPSIALALLIGVFTAGLATAAETPADQAKAKTKPYTLTTCIVSGDKLGGDMGEAITKVYGDREIKFCCKGCIKNFEKDQAGYVKKIEEAEAAAAAAKAAPAKSATPAAKP